MIHLVQAAWDFVSYFAKRLACRHRQTVFVRRIYAEEINATGHRELHHCLHCGGSVYRQKVDA